MTYGLLVIWMCHKQDDRIVNSAEGKVYDSNILGSKSQECGLKSWGRTEHILSARQMLRLYSLG